MPRFNALTEKELIGMRSMYLSGESTIDVAIKFGRSVSSVVKSLYKAGMTGKSTAEIRRKDAIKDRHLISSLRKIKRCKGYLIGKDGRVFSSRMGAIIEIYPYKNKRGYASITVDKNNILVHQLVLETFVGQKPSNAHITRHIDGNTSNNHVSNLAWGTQKENIQDSIRHGTHWTISKPWCASKGDNHWLRKNPERMNWKYQKKMCVRGSDVYGSKLTKENVLEILEKRRNKGIKTSALSIEYGVNVSSIKCILCGKTWGHVTKIKPRRNK